MTAFERFVALGDSFTEGLCDRLGPDGRHLGWADRVAEALAVHGGQLHYANLAVRGRLLHEVAAEQVPIAVASSPDLVSFHAGGNDVLRPKADLDVLARRYDAAVAALQLTGARVVVFTVLENVGRTGRLADGMSRRIATFNRRVVRPTAARRDAVLVDVGPVAALQDPRLWADDRLHLVEEGHRRISAAVLEALGVADPALLGGPVGWWREPLPAGPPATRVATLTTDVRWVRRHLLPWVGRRLRGVSSGDQVVCKRPELVELRPQS